MPEPHGISIPNLPETSRASIEYKDINVAEISISGHGVTSTFTTTNGILTADVYTALDSNQPNEDTDIHNQRYMLVGAYLHEQSKRRDLPPDIEDFY